MDTEHDELEAFVERVLTQLAKNGFPERRVSFPIERLYDSAYAKGLSFNKVLALLLERGIAHEKTPEKIVFARVEDRAEAIEGTPLDGLDASRLAGLSREELMARAASAMQQMSPEQLAAMRAMVEGMTPAQQEEMTEHARKLGLL